MNAGRGAELLAVLGDLGLEAGALEILADEPMARHTTLRLGGPADLWIRPATEEALARLLVRAHAHALPVTFVGSGSNLVVRDGGIRGLVVNLARLGAVERGPEPTEVRVQAGASTGRLLRAATDWELGGVEFLGGVPGSVGGGLRMNAGTVLGEFTDVVTSMRSLRPDGREVVRDHGACGFRYRGSELPRDEIVVSAVLHLCPRARADIEADVRALRERRREREPHGVHNCGSAFKNPPGDHAGRLIDAAGLKGTRVGGAMVSPVHANWLVVAPDATATCTTADLLGLVEVVQRAVRARFGVELELEVKVVGQP